MFIIHYETSQKKWRVSPSCTLLKGLVWASIGIPSAATALDLVSVKVPWHLLGVDHEVSRDVNRKGTPGDPRFDFWYMDVFENSGSGTLKFDPFS